VVTFVKVVKDIRLDLISHAVTFNHFHLIQYSRTAAADVGLRGAPAVTGEQLDYGKCAADVRINQVVAEEQRQPNRAASPGSRVPQSQ
jgi:hypothetical protein